MYSRRDFTKIAIGAAGALQSGAFGAINSKVNGVRLGIQTYSFRQMPLDDALKAMVECGIGEAEVFAQHVETAAGSPVQARPAGGPRPPQPPAGAGEQKGGEQKKKGGGFRPDPEFRNNVRKWRLSVPLEKFAEIRKKFDAAGIVPHAYNLSFREDFTPEEIDHGFLMAKALGVKFITASSTVKAAKMIAPFADKHKMIVAMHNHSNLRDDNEFAKPESFAAAVAMSKYFRINLDIGHFTAAGFDPVDYIKKHHKMITNLHLKDRKKNDGPNTVWGEGDTQIKDVLQLLKKAKYPIPADIEYEYQGADSIAEVKKCMAYCRTALA